MKQQTIIYTALPNGVVTPARAGGASVKLSVFVSPRLETNEGGARPTLSQFSDFLDWPARIAGATFSVRFNGAAPVKATAVAAEPDAPDSSLWKAIFTGTTYVEPHKFPDLSLVDIHSFPVKNVIAHIKTLYQSAAVETPTQIPHLHTADAKHEVLKASFQSIALTQEDQTALSTQIAAHKRTNGTRAVRNTVMSTSPLKRNVTIPAGRFAVLQPGVAQAGSDFYQVAAFHGLDVRQRRMPMPTPALLVNSIDFHQILSSLGQYPRLMRRLGLVIDLEVPLSGGVLPADGVVQVLVDLKPVSTATVQNPKTHYVTGPGRFMAKPRLADGDLSNGMLRLDDEDRFEVVQMDVDGAAVKTLQLAQTVAPALKMMALTAKAPAEQQAPPQEAALPALRSAGLGIARANRAHEMSLQLKRSAVLNASLIGRRAAATPEEQELFAEDITRGYRVDVWDAQTAHWHSLCQRVGKYTLTGSARTFTIEDEGWVSTAATKRPDDPTGALQLHEALFRWEGWSLCAPRPGKAVKQEGVPEDTERKFGLDTAFVAKPGSLPRLRFGREYRLRARVVDLAGNSIPPDSADESAASDPVEYERHEPITAPVVVPRIAANKPGESVDRLVIRSFNSSLDRDRATSTESAERHIVPPKVSELMAETHSMFDTETGMKTDPSVFTLIASHDGVVPDNADTDQIAPLPYLPDPLAYGGAVRFAMITRSTVTGTKVQSSVAIPFDGTWPDVRPFRIVAVEPTDTITEPTFDAPRRVLLVPLRKADMATIELSCYIKPKFTPPMAVWRWSAEEVIAPSLKGVVMTKPQLSQLQRELPKANQLQVLSGPVKLNAQQLQTIGVLHEHFAKGHNWLLTPSRALTFVHAVQQPLVVPKFTSLHADRIYGATYAVLDDIPMPIDGRSTAKLEVLAQWDEPLDTARVDQLPTRIKGSAHVFDYSPQQDDTQFVFNPDTKAPLRPIREPVGPVVIPRTDRTVTPVRPVKPVVKPAKPIIQGALPVPEGEAGSAVLAGVETTGKVLPMGKVTPVGKASVVNSLSAVDMAAILRAVQYRHEFGDTKYRRVTYTATATTRFREYFPADQIANGSLKLTRESQPVTIDVPSSARPAAPKVLYVIPTFGWQRGANDTGATSRRFGGGLRVYLERPWYSSGDGELLGVVLYTQMKSPVALATMFAKTDDSLLKPYVTQWGADPIWAAGNIGAVPAFGDFRGAVTEDGLHLDELPGARVAVAGYPVQYDETRQLWFADIEIDPGAAYYPFVRLALARYQPNSVKTADTDVKLSRVVLAEYAQLAPDRTASVTVVERRRIDVSVTGPTYRGPRMGAREAQMKVTLETRNPQIPGELGWVPVAKGEYPMYLTFKERQSTWVGQIPLPDDYQHGKYRLVIQEYEWFHADKASDPIDLSAPSPLGVMGEEAPAGGVKPMMMVLPQAQAARVVYAEVLEI